MWWWTCRIRWVGHGMADCTRRQIQFGLNNWGPEVGWGRPMVSLSRLLLDAMYVLSFWLRCVPLEVPSQSNVWIFPAPRRHSTAPVGQAWTIADVRLTGLFMPLSSIADAGDVALRVQRFLASGEVMGLLQASIQLWQAPWHCN